MHLIIERSGLPSRNNTFCDTVHFSFYIPESHITQVIFIYLYIYKSISKMLNLNNVFVHWWRIAFDRWWTGSARPDLVSHTFLLHVSIIYNISMINNNVYISGLLFSVRSVVVVCVCVCFFSAVGRRAIGNIRFFCYAGLVCIIRLFSVWNLCVSADRKRMGFLIIFIANLI